MSAPRVIRLTPQDNVAIAVESLAAGDPVDPSGSESAATVARDAIPAGHKVSLVAMPAGTPVRRYGQTIGFAASEIGPGSHVHTHNVTADGFDRAHEFATDLQPPPRATTPRTFRGYLRPDGRAGTRNYVAVISTVNCSASASRFIAERLPRDALASRPSIDGIIALTHKGGCTGPLDGDDHLRLERVLAGFAGHPNVGACLLVGLGCEVTQAASIIARQGLGGRSGIRVMVIQEQGGLRKTVEAGVTALQELLPEAAAVERVDLPASMLVLGTQCGGSDGFSGVTANPALGAAADLLVAQGGTVILAETPELVGAEHLLTRRAMSREVGEALLGHIRWWEWYANVFGATIDNNPTPGNKAGGLTTIYEKSLGAVAKGGTTPLAAVYRYAEPVATSGLVVMDTPGNDPISLTGVVAGGANVCAFTTGRGSVYGCKPSPCVKIASTSRLYRHMVDDMDFDAGVILDGTPLELAGTAIFEELLAVASGKKTKSEAQGVGDEEFAPWVVGPVL